MRAKVCRLLRVYGVEDSGERVRQVSKILVTWQSVKGRYRILD